MVNEESINQKALGCPSWPDILIVTLPCKSAGA
jgi:hypothetical protein